MIGKRTLIAISAAMTLGVLGASAAQANDSGEDRGGFVVPGSMVGVNPVYHPDLFGGAGYASAARNAYGYAIAPVHKQRHEQTQGR
jgi:hypothetical protein